MITSLYCQCNCSLQFYMFLDGLVTFSQLLSPHFNCNNKVFELCCTTYHYYTGCCQPAPLYWDVQCWCRWIVQLPESKDRNLLEHFLPGRCFEGNDYYKDPWREGEMEVGGKRKKCLRKRGVSAYPHLLQPSPGTPLSFIISQASKGILDASQKQAQK